MSILNLNVNDAKDLTLLEDGETELRILSAEVKAGRESGKQYVNIRFEAPDTPEAEDIFHIMMLPSADVSDFKDENDMKKQNNKRLLAFRDFYNAFGIDGSREVDIQHDLKGAVGRGLIATKDDPEYGEKNVIKRFLAAR